MLYLNLFIFLIISSFAVAKLEIQIEGKDGWAKNLPTWRIKNKLTDLIWNNQPFTGYHLWLMVTVFVFLHFPLFLGTIWSLSLEFLLTSLFFFFFLLEDFFWFVFNPHFGLKKFHKDHIDWHHHWIFNIPSAYFRFILAGSIFLIFSFLI